MTTPLTDKIEAYLAAIEQREPSIQAWQTLFADAARERARSLAQSAEALPLCGLTVGLKDIFDLAGYAPGHGLAFDLAPPAQENAAVVARLLAAGAIVLGTTRLTEYCYFRAPATRNPHNPAHTPGGSSSGSAAAVAAGTAELAVGTQTLGSTIRPASFCGVYGFKPTLGAISLAGASALSRSMDHVGLFARRSDDLIAAFEVLAGTDARDPLSRPVAAADEHPPRRLGVVDLADSVGLAPDMRRAFNAYVEELARSGWRVDEVVLPFSLKDARAWAQDVLRPEAFANLRGLIDTPEYDRLGPEIRRLIEAGARVPLADYFAARERQAAAAAAFDELLAVDDFLLLPSALGAAPEGLESTGDPVCTAVTSLTGVPAASVPFALADNGLPLGAQIVARQYQDRTLLAALSYFPARLPAPKFG